MIYIGIHGTRVPEWLQKIEPTGAGFKPGRLTWRGISVVTWGGGAFEVRPLYPTPHLMKLNGARQACVTGQSPKGGPGMVTLNLRAILPGWFLAVMATVPVVLAVVGVLRP